MAGGAALITLTGAAVLTLNFVNQQGKRAAGRRPLPPEGPLFTDTSFLPPAPGNPNV
jgi:hypothetical protein